MSEKQNALENLVNEYLDRKREQNKVEAKYAQYKQELAQAKEKDNRRVAEALAACWQAGVKVAETGRALGTSNIYTARREIYDIAREILLGAKEEDKEFLDALYRKARGETFEERRTGDEPVEVTEENYHEVPVDEEGYPDQEAWVLSWEISNIDAETWKVDDPAGRVNTISMGKVLGYQGKNLTEFMKDDALHEIVYRVFPQVKMEEN
jgi:hypothetical protein